MKCPYVCSNLYFNSACISIINLYIIYFNVIVLNLKCLFNKRCFYVDIDCQIIIFKFIAMFLSILKLKLKLVLSIFETFSNRPFCDNR